MKLGHALIAIFAMATLVGEAAGQGLAPLRKDGATPSDRKAFYVNVKNPYASRLKFRLDVMESDYWKPASNAWVFPQEMTIAPNGGRRVTLIMEIPDDANERTIALCATAPDLETAVLPRVCGTYSGRRLVPR